MLSVVECLEIPYELKSVPGSSSGISQSRNFWECFHLLLTVCAKELSHFWQATINQTLDPF